MYVWLIHRWTQVRLRPSPSARFGHCLALLDNNPPAPHEDVDPANTAPKTLIMYGGCIDTTVSGFLAALSRSYAQTNELWALTVGASLLR